jgi:DNA-binding Lrp family transcriptional regulator
MLRSKMKKLDRKILLQLIEDSEQPITKIAERVGTSRQTVAKKIKQFKTSGLLDAFMPKLDMSKFGLNKAYVFLREHTQTALRDKNEEAIKKLHQVSRFHRLFGRYSAVLEVWTKDSQELTALVKKIHGLEGMRETETFIVHSTVKDNPEDPLVKVLKSSGHLPQH